MYTNLNNQDKKSNHEIIMIKIFKMKKSYILTMDFRNLPILIK